MIFITLHESKQYSTGILYTEDN